MNSKLIVSSVVAALALGAVAYVALDERELSGPAPGQRVVALTSPTSTPASRPTLIASPATGERVAAVQPSAPAVAAQVADPEPSESVWSLRGRVIDTEASPMGGIELVIEGETPTFTSLGGGGFETSTSHAKGHVVPAPSTSTDWVAVHQAYFERDSSLEPVLVVARALQFAGSVVDEFGAPVANAMLELALPDSLNAVLGRVLDSTRSQRFFCISNAYGDFDVSGTPRIAGAEWHVTADGYQRTIVAAPAADEFGRTIVLEQPALPLEGRLAGRVVDPYGEPVEGARVAVGVTSTKTNDAGEFHLDLSRALTADKITAAKDGYQAAIEVCPGYAADDGLMGWPPYVELSLGGPPLSLRGRVVRSDGTPVAGARVWTPDGTRFGMVGMMPITIENLMAGAPIPPEAHARRLPEQDNPESTFGVHTSGGDPNAFWNWVTTDEGGRFELPGLFDQDYRLTAMDTASLLQVTTPSFAAGTRGVKITLADEDLEPVVRGRVVTERGKPVPGVHVTMHREAYFVRARFFGGNAEIGIEEDRATVTTDHDGMFELAGVPKEGMRLRLRSDTIVPTTANVPEELTEAGITSRRPKLFDIVVDVRCHLRVALDDVGDDANQVAALDEDGNIIPLLHISEGSVTSNSHVALVDGKTGVLSVSSRAQTLRVMNDGDVVFELAIDLLPGEVTVIE